MSKSVNRSLDDPIMDDIDHALGRPRNPLGETYRNYYAALAGSEIAKAMAASPYWSEIQMGSGSSLACFQVTPDGREALAGYLKATGDKS